MRLVSHIVAVVGLTLLFVISALGAESVLEKVERELEGRPAPPPKASARTQCDALARARDKFDAARRLGGQAFDKSLQAYGELQEVERQLSILVEEGNTAAAYCLAVHYEVDWCYRDLSDPSELQAITRLIAKSCAQSTFLYRKAAEKGHYAAAANLAEQYRDGRGTERSALAAVEWYYKAGRLALKDQDRDFALRMLEQMLKLSPKHLLSLDLYKQLYPRSLENQKKRSPSPKSQTM